MNGIFRSAALAVAMIVAWGGSAAAAEPHRILIDDFNDGNDEGWTHDDHLTTGGPGTNDPTSYAYNLSSTGPVTPGQDSWMGARWDASVDPFYSNGFFRMKVRSDSLYTGTTFGMRRQFPQESGYYFSGHLAGNRNFGFYRNSGGNFTWHSAGVSYGAGEEWIFEGGVVGDQVSVKVWRDGDPEPASPQLTFTDSSPLPYGVFNLETWVDTRAPGPTVLDATYDDIYFTPVSLADFNIDFVVDEQDLAIWQQHYGASGNVTHAMGDADSDDRVTGSDFLIWQRQYVASVPELATEIGIPEPASIALLATGMALCGLLAKQHRRRE